MNTKHAFINAFINAVVNNQYKFIGFANHHLFLDNIQVCSRRALKYYLSKDSNYDDNSRPNHDKWLVVNHNLQNLSGFGSFNHAMLNTLDTGKLLENLDCLDAKARYKVMKGMLDAIFNETMLDCKKVYSDTDIDNICLGLGLNNTMAVHFLKECDKLVIDNDANELEFGDTLAYVWGVVCGTRTPEIVNAELHNKVDKLEGTAHFEEKKEEPKPKKSYSVAVHATFVFDTNVVAESREEAERIAFERAKTSSSTDWEFVDYMDSGEVYDED